MNDLLQSAASSRQQPERDGYELLAWAVLEQAVIDLATFARYGMVAASGRCLPWPVEMRRRFKIGRRGQREMFWHRCPRTIAASHGPFDHVSLVAWWLSEDAQTYCDLLGCEMPARQIFADTIRTHGGLN
jgi:hypothetical protein